MGFANMETFDDLEKAIHKDTNNAFKHIKPKGNELEHARNILLKECNKLAEENNVEIDVKLNNDTLDVSVSFPS